MILKGLRRGLGVVTSRMSSSSLLYRSSLEAPLEFWTQQAKDVSWTKFVAPRQLSDKGEWFEQSELNFCYNCVDLHVENGHGKKTAIIFDSPVTSTVKKVTYSELQRMVQACATVLSKQMSVKKGDRVIIYMPNSIEAVVAMLSCARLGATHSVVFGGFAPHELAVRIKDCQPTAIIYSSCGIEGSKIVPYAPLVQKALEVSQTSSVKSMLVYQRPQHPQQHPQQPKHLDWETEMARAASSSEDLARHGAAISVNSSHPLYILYTSGTTGAPKGVQRDTGGYAVGLKWAMRNVFGVEPGTVFWGASDVGWVVGHLSYYGSLLMGATALIYEGKPVGTPDEANFWRTCERHKVQALFTAPTALRAIKKLDDQGVASKKFNLSALKGIFCAGEHLDPDTKRWAELTGKVVLDNWWQTETGWPMTGPMVGVDGWDANAQKCPPGAAFRPVPGWGLRILDHNGNEKPAGEMGFLVAKLPAPPGFMTGLYNSRERFESSYLRKFPGYYDTGDAGAIDKDGFVYIMSRVDDVINVAGHRFSTGSMEECLSELPEVAEVAVIGVKDTFKGQLPLGLAVLNASAVKARVTEAQVAAKAKAIIRERIGAVACFGEDRLVLVDALPKTRSGKILRGVLRSIANHEEYKIPPTIEDEVVLVAITEVIRNREK